MSNERVPWEESNLAGIGSDLDKKIREAAAENEAQWEDIGQEPCVKVWRIEQFQVVPWPENKNGRFHVGDSYIVLNSYLVEDKLCHDVHIWIGSESSQDEYGTAAYKVRSHVIDNDWYIIALCMPSFSHSCDVRFRWWSVTTLSEGLLSSTERSRATKVTCSSPTLVTSCT